MRNEKLLKLLNTLIDYDYDIEEIGNDSYIDLFYRAVEKLDNTELIEIIYHCFNAMLYNSDFEDLKYELIDNGIIEDDEE